MNEYLNRLKQIMEEKKISEAAFSRTINVQPSTINSLFQRNGIPKSDLSRRISDAFKLNLTWLLTGEGPMYQDEAGPPLMPGRKAIPTMDGHLVDNPNQEVAFIVPMLEQAVSAGCGSVLDEQDRVVGYIALPSAIQSRGLKLAALEVKGDSMYPTIDIGDLVVCDAGGYDGEGVYAIRLNDEALVKRLSPYPGGVTILSDNPKYPPRDVPKLDVIGRVRAVVKVLK